MDMGHFNHMGYLRDKFKNHYFIDENGYIQDFQDFIAEGPGVREASSSSSSLVKTKGMIENLYIDDESFGNEPSANNEEEEVISLINRVI